ncbi:MAG TPA: phosphotransferase [Mycobacteriales bacterium]|nr:phosphotransferase [Mycobacteriales bacterium]
MVELARFGPLRSNPPDGVLNALAAKRSEPWSAGRLGAEGGFPNGGMWRVKAGEAATVVKRTGPRHLGTDPVWRGSADPDDPQWWGREAEFYCSELATRGWGSDCRAARCYDIDDHGGVRDLWLEDVAGIPLPRERYEGVVAGFARWQRHNQAVDRRWLSRGWIPAHLRRRRLDNAETITHPEWDRLIDLGVPASFREGVRHRITDPATAAAILDSLPQGLTHYDFHHMNIGQVAGQIVIIDWATVGWGPLGHDAGFMLIDHAVDLGESIEDTWNDLIGAYAAALGQVDAGEIRRSAAISNVIRLGWTIDHLLANSAAMADGDIAALLPVVKLLAHHQARYLE